MAAMTKRVFLDIETLPPDENQRGRVAEEVVQEMESSHILGDDLTLLIDERYKGLALHGEYGRLLAIGIIVEEDSSVLYHGVLGRDRLTGRFHLDEVRTLRSFWKLLRGFNDRCDLLVGHNVLDFDLQFLCKRSIIHNVKPSFNICFARFRQRPVFDTMWEWSHWRKCISLQELAEILGIKSPKSDGIDGSLIYENYCMGNHDEIALYCMRDVECVREIYYRMNFLQSPPLEPYSKGINSNASSTVAIQV